MYIYYVRDITFAAAAGGDSNIIAIIGGALGALAALIVLVLLLLFFLFRFVCKQHRADRLNVLHCIVLMGQSTETFPFNFCNHDKAYECFTD